MDTEHMIVAEDVEDDDSDYDDSVSVQLDDAGPSVYRLNRNVDTHLSL